MGDHQMILEQGEPFEMTHKQWLRERLPSYEQVWRDFIGYDGFCRPLPIRGLSPELERRRRTFYQAHFTIAKRCFSIDELLKRTNDALVAIQSHEDLWKEFEFLYVLMGAIGHVRDMIIKIDDALRLGGKICEPFQDFYSLRSHILHSPQMPFFVDSGFLKIPLIATRNKTAEQWDDASHWDDMDPSTFVFASDFCRTTITDFFALINTVHPAIYDGADRLFGGRKVDWSRRTAEARMTIVDGPTFLTNMAAGSANMTPIRLGARGASGFFGVTE